MIGDKHENVIANLPLGIRFYESKVSTDGYVPFHWHNSIEVLCVLEGTLNLTVDGKLKVVNANECLAISSGLVHDVTNTPNHAFVLQIPLRILNPFVEHPHQLSFNMVREKNPNSYQTMIDSLRRMNETLQKKKQGFLFDAEILFIEILKLLVLDFTEPAPLKNRIGTSIRNMLSYINEHYKENLSVTKLANLIGYNANYLSRLFHFQVGTSLIEYIYRVRLVKFHQALLETDKSIGALMSEFSLNNERTSREMFQKIYKMLPLAARKNYQNVLHFS